MTTETPAARYRLYGSIGSPYALKLRALMRYKRLPFDWVPATLDWIPGALPHPPLCAAANQAIAQIRPRVVPAVYFPADGSIRNDSTFVAHALDAEGGERPVIPRDPCIAFLSHLIEDMADEWLVKVAFLYRWGNAPDAAHKSRVVSGEFLGGGYGEEIRARSAAHFMARQQSRMPLVGCTPDNAPLIVASFRRFLAAMERLPTYSTFLFGATPTLADFGIFGQAQSLATDPTPWAVMREEAPAIFAYLQVLDDASGIEPAAAAEPLLPEPTLDLLRLSAAVYLPYLAANAAALAEERPEFSFTADGLPYRQAPFKYQAKCLQWLEEEFAALPPPARRRAAEVLDAVGGLDVFDGRRAARSLRC